MSGVLRIRLTHAAVSAHQEPHPDIPLDVAAARLVRIRRRNAQDHLWRLIELVRLEHERVTPAVVDEQIAVDGDRHRGRLRHGRQDPQEIGHEVQRRRRLGFLRLDDLHLVG
jgi:hypothetical protein